MESRACLPHSKFKEANTCCEFMAVQWNPVFKRLESPLGCCTIRQVVRCQFWVVVGRLVQAIASWGELPLTSVELIFGSLIVAFSFFLFFGHTGRHAGSPFPDQALNLYPLQWKHGVLTSGPPGNSHYCYILKLLKILFFSSFTKTSIGIFFFFFFRSSTGSL